MVLAVLCPGVEVEEVEGVVVRAAGLLICLLPL